ncbi:MAG TPA: RNA polymerase sigma factor [Ktedonobacteraceae bacterium]|nr:RNA polymerase sigma factor [Ktedonobacteraceae bacterium]
MIREKVDLPTLLATDLNGYFGQLVLDYQHRLYTFALHQTGSAEDAEDIVQEALLRAYYALGDYPAERVRMLKLQPWLYKIALHVYYNRSRQLKLSMVPLNVTEDSSLLDIEDDWHEQPEVAVEDAERVRELESLLATLPEQYRTAVSLYYFEELSYREIADLLSQPMGTVKSNLHRGVRLLREALAKQGLHTM